MKITMSLSLAIVTAGAVVSLAVASGEPKNERPFTRVANDDPGYAIALRAIARNEIPPLASRGARPGSPPAGEAPSLSSGTPGIAIVAVLAVGLAGLSCGLTMIWRRRQRLDRVA